MGDPAHCADYADVWSSAALCYHPAGGREDSDYRASQGRVSRGLFSAHPHAMSAVCQRRSDTVELC